MEDVKKVSNTIISKANECGDKIDLQRLQRFLYFVEGWSLAVLDKSAFSEKITKTKFGPVVKSIYYDIAGKFGANSINRYKLGNGEKVNCENLNSLIDEVYKSYRHLSTEELTGITIAVHGNLSDKGRNSSFDIKGAGTPCESNSFYSPQKMKKYFSDILDDSNTVRKKVNKE